MKFRNMVLTTVLAVAVMSGTAPAAEIVPEKSPTGDLTPTEKCPQRQIPIGLYGAANQLLEAAQYAQWVLEDIVCKYPNEEEAKKALIKLNGAISQAEGH